MKKAFALLGALTLGAMVYAQQQVQVPVPPVTITIPANCVLNGSVVTCSTVTPPPTCPSPGVVVNGTCTCPPPNTTVNGTCTPPSPPPNNNAAFPGAEGAGALSKGGRGGTSMDVTNLNDSGSGSLRSCVTASMPRTCNLRVAGTITNKSRLQVWNPYLTIDGSAAPGTVYLGGKGQVGEALFISTHDVIVRYVSFDGSNPDIPPGPEGGTVGFELASGDVHDVIFDHVSSYHYGNKGFVIYANGQPVKNVTYQWSLMYEPNKLHPVGPHLDASMRANECTNIDFHHNVFINVGHRMPMAGVKSVRWMNNIVYNWDWFAALFQGGVNVDIIGNNYVHGNMNQGDNGGHAHQFEFNNTQSTDDPTRSMPGPPSAYMRANIGAQLSDPNGNQSLLAAKVDSEGGPETGSMPSSWIRNSPMPVQGIPITENSVTTLDFILDTVGNSIHRDANDARVIAQYRAKGPGGFFQ